MSDSNKLIDSFFKKLATSNYSDDETDILYSAVYHKGGLKYDEFIKRVMAKKEECCELCVKVVTDFVITAIDKWNETFRNDIKQSTDDVNCYCPVEQRKIDDIIQTYNREFKYAVDDIREELFKEIRENKELFQKASEMYYSEQ